jgi:hypothetical protein
MITSFLHSFQSEWLKKKRSLASWIVIIGGFFTPAIIIVARIVNADRLCVGWILAYALEKFMGVDGNLLITHWRCTRYQPDHAT